MDYDYLAAMLGGQDKASLPSPNTTLSKLGDALCLMYYNTNILTYRPGGSIEISSEGMRTKSTKKRINKYLPPGYKVKQIEGSWYLITPEGKQPFKDNERITIKTTSANLKDKTPKKVKTEESQQMTQEQTIMEQLKNFNRKLNSDIMPARRLTEADTGGVGTDPAAAPVGSPVPTPGEGQEIKDPAIAPTAEQPGEGGEDRVEKLKEEIYEVMKKNGDATKGFIVELFTAKGYEEKEIENALKALEGEGRLGSNPIYHLKVEEEPGEEGKEGAEAGIGDETTQGDVTAPPEPANQQQPPTAKAAMRNAAKNAEEDRFGDEGEQDAFSEEEPAGEDQFGDENPEDEFEQPEEHADPHEEPEGGEEGDPFQKIEDIEDDMRDVAMLLKPIPQQLRDIIASLRKRIKDESPDEMAAMRNLRRAKDRMRNHMGANGAVYPAYGAEDQNSNPGHAVPMGQQSRAKSPMRNNAYPMDNGATYPKWGEQTRYSNPGRR